MLTEAKNPYHEQIMRCSSLQKFPLYAEGVKELRVTLKNCTGTPERARRLLDELLSDRDTCPTPREIREVGEALMAREEQSPAGCSICEGKPWISVEMLVYEFPKAHGEMRGKQYMTAGAERCRCAKGEYFRARDRENNAKRAAGLPV